MTTAVLDTLRCAQTLKDAGFAPKQAEATAQVLGDALADVATKEDLDRHTAVQKADLHRHAVMQKADLDRPRRQTRQQVRLPERKDQHPHRIRRHYAHSRPRLRLPRHGTQRALGRTPSHRKQPHRPLDHHPSPHSPTRTLGSQPPTPPAFPPTHDTPNAPTRSQEPAP